MCGHVGVASKVLTDQTKKAFYDMLYLDVLRGEDSTGVAAISKPFEDGTEVEVFKSVGSATDFFYDHSKFKRGRDFTSKPVGIMIGHNRFATQGGVNIENAHPFEFDNVVGAHNGTVSQWSLRDFHGHKDFDVDSQIIFSHLSHTRSIDEVWEKADGALALVWWDKIDNKLNIIRNAQRPMHIAYSEDDKTVFWASELWMILVAAMRHSIKLKDPIEAKPNKLYTFSNTVEGKMFHVERDLPPFVEKRVVVSYGPRGATYGSYWDDWGDYTPPAVKKDETPVMLLIKEFNDIASNPSAIARTEDGELVKIHISVSDYRTARDKIIGRGNTKGYYVVPRYRMFDSHAKEVSLWTAWTSLNYVSLKDSSIVNEGDGGFRLSHVNNPQYAPFVKGTYLTQGAWENKVSCGCFNCQRVPNWGEKNELEWFDKDTYLCKDCKELSFFQDLKAN